MRKIEDDLYDAFGFLATDVVSEMSYPGLYYEIMPRLTEDEVSAAFAFLEDYMPYAVDHEFRDLYE